MRNVARLVFSIDVPDECVDEPGDDSRRRFLWCRDTELIAGVYIETPGIEIPVTEEEWEQLERLATSHGLHLHGARYEWWVTCDATIYSNCIERIRNFLIEARRLLGKR